MEDEKKKIVLNLTQFEVFKLEQIINLGTVELEKLEMKTNPKSKIALEKAGIISRFGSRILSKVTVAIEEDNMFSIERAIFEKQFVEKIRSEGIKECDRAFGGF